MSAEARRAAIAACRVLWVTDRIRLRAPLAEHAERLLAAGLPVLVLRERDLADGPFEDLARRLVQSASARGARVLLTNRAEVAARAGASGVHLGRGGPDAFAARRAVGDKAWIGASVHEAADLGRPDREQIDYWIASPVFVTESKPGVAPLGLGAFAALCRRAERPVFALGGVRAENAASCFAAGAAGVAVIGALSGDEPEAEWRRLAAALTPVPAADVAPQKV